jgi:HEAT repeat protein
MQTPDAVKTVLRHPRRLEELLDMLGDKDLSIRGRAAATLARLAESHSEGLLKAMPRLREHINDDSDYVRWHLVYAFGKIGASVLSPAREYWADVFAGMDDDSRIVRMIAGKAAALLAAAHPDAVAAFFRDAQRPVPGELAKFLSSE